MRIKVKTEGKKKVSLRLPNALFYNKLFLRVVSKQARKKHDFNRTKRTGEARTSYFDLEKAGAAMPGLGGAIKMAKKKHGHIVLVEVEDSDGDGVIITL